MKGYPAIRYGNWRADALRNDNSGNTGETFNNHTCLFLGIFEFGPSGPSIMSYAAGTQTFCFAASPSGGVPNKNLTLIAEHLHDVIK